MFHEQSLIVRREHFLRIAWFHTEELNNYLSKFSRQIVWVCRPLYSVNADKFIIVSFVSVLETRRWHCVVINTEIFARLSSPETSSFEWKLVQNGLSSRSITFLCNLTMRSQNYGIRNITQKAPSGERIYRPK